MNVTRKQLTPKYNARLDSKSRHVGWRGTPNAINLSCQVGCKHGLPDFGLERQTKPVDSRLEMVGGGGVIRAFRGYAANKIKIVLLNSYIAVVAAGCSCTV